MDTKLKRIKSERTLSNKELKDQGLSDNINVVLFSKSNTEIFY